MLRAERHRARFERSYQARFGSTPPYDLLEGIGAPPEGPVYKLRIAYGRKNKSWEWIPYSARNVQSLRIAVADDLKYEMKYSDRRAIDLLFEQRGSADDVLLIRQGRVTDTSYSNIAFQFQGRWFTPDPPLLAGTHRAALIETRQLEPCPIRISEIPEFEGFQLINAMLEFRPDYFVPITHIHL